MTTEERDRESLYVRARVSAKTIATIVGALGALGGGAYKTAQHEAEVAKLRGEILLLRNDVQRAERAYTDTERYCALERALVDEIGARVSLAAAWAEPDKRKRLSAGADAQGRFILAASWWPCPMNFSADRSGKPSLATLAASAANAPVPGR